MFYSSTDRSSTKGKETLNITKVLGNLFEVLLLLATKALASTLGGFVRLLVLARGGHYGLRHERKVHKMSTLTIRYPNPAFTRISVPDEQLILLRRYLIDESVAYPIDKLIHKVIVEAAPMRDKTRRTELLGRAGAIAYLEGKGFEEYVRSCAQLLTGSALPSSTRPEHHPDIWQHVWKSLKAKWRRATQALRRRTAETAA